MEAYETSNDLLRRLIIDPTHEWKTAWDAYIGLWTLFSIFLIPMVMGLESVEKSRGVQVVSLFADCMFAIDICVNFRTAFLNETGVYDTIPTHIFGYYAKNWLLIDLLSTIPFNLMSSGSSNAKGLKLIRFIRLMKLFRLLKLKRLRIPDEIQELDISVKKGVKLLMTLAFIAHMFGCFWNTVSLTTGGGKFRLFF